MPTYDVREAKTHLSRLLDAVQSGVEREIVIARAGKPAARLTAVLLRASRSGSAWPRVAMLATLPLIHREPFDRLLVAQAFAEPLRLVTHDRQVTTIAIR